MVFGMITIERKYHSHHISRVVLSWLILCCQLDWAEGCSDRTLFLGVFVRAFPEEISN